MKYRKSRLTANTSISGHRGSRKFCGICFCTGDPSYTLGSTERAYRVEHPSLAIFTSKADSDIALSWEHIFWMRILGRSESWDVQHA